MQIDIEFENLIPKLSNEEFKQLEENIKSEGCREALIVWNGILIDGHNRYKICKQNNIDFKIIEKNFSNREEAKMWIIKNQFGRRNLSIYDRSVLALKLENLFKEKAKANMLATQNNNSASAFQKSEKQINTTKEIAKIAGTSHDTISKVKKIEEKAPDDVKVKVKKGEMSINQAYNYAKTYEYLENEIKDEPKKEMSEQEEKDREYLQEQFKEIERIKGTEIRMNEAIFKILTVQVNEENVQIWMDGLEDYRKDNLVNELDEAIEKYEFIKKMWFKHNQIRRIK